MQNDPVGAFLDYPPLPVRNADAGPLAGLTLAVKDLFDVRGYPTGGGHPLLREQSSAKERHAPVVRDLLNAGARFIGKTHTDEFAYSMNGENPHYGTPVNPRAPGRIPGGSSSGSAAAVAAGLADIALGTDTGGSIRLPASYCGLIGLRTSHGRISLDGLQPLASSFDTVGWFARDAAVYERVADVLLGDDPSARAIERLVFVTDIADRVLGEVEHRETARWREKISGIIPIQGETVICPHGFDNWRQIFRTIQAYEVWRDHGEWISRNNPKFGPGVGQRFEWARTVTDGAYRKALDQREEVMRWIRSMLLHGTALVFPTAPAVAPAPGMKGEDLEAYRTRSISMLCGAGLAGLPQISVPLGDIDGMPFGISLMGGHGTDRALLGLAKTLLDIPKTD